MSYPVMLSVVVLDSTNNTINFREGANTALATLAEGTYFARGDGSADDLLLVLKTGLETNVGARTSTNTYTPAIAWSVDADAPCAVVTVPRTTGADSFQFIASGSTFDFGLLGFDLTANPDTLTAGPKTSTLSPSCAWVSSDLYEEFEPEDEDDDAYVEVGRSGIPNAGTLSETFGIRRLALQMVGEKRTHSVRIAADVHRAFDRFRQLLVRGRRFELHFGSISAGSTLATLSTATTRQGTAWALAEESAKAFRPERMSMATRLYSWALRLRAWVA